LVAELKVIKVAVEEKEAMVKLSPWKSTI